MPEGEVQSSRPGPVDRLLGAVARLPDGLPRTLLAVCPNSEAVTHAAIAAAARLDAPLLFAATLNQVDRDGGYTGWTPRAFAEAARRFAQSEGFRGPLALCLDHGGPWLKDAHTAARLSFEETFSEVRASLEACLDAGYGLLHIDPTVDRALPDGAPPSVETVSRRTAALIAHAERHRERNALPPVSYEVGTEEVHGGLADPSAFRALLESLRGDLENEEVGGAWPCFVVGKVGTDLHTTTFCPQTAGALARIAREYGCSVKGHYTDGVSNPEDYPTSGMGGANVGPEFTEAEFEALADLEAREADLGCSPAGVVQALEEAVVASGRWEKWRLPEEAGLEFAGLSSERRRWLVRTGCRYIWTDARVLAARARLRANLAAHGIDAEAAVRERIGAVVEKYLRAFGLVGCGSALLRVDPSLARDAGRD